MTNPPKKSWQGSDPPPHLLGNARILMSFGTETPPKELWNKVWPGEVFTTPYIETQGLAFTPKSDPIPFQQEDVVVEIKLTTTTKNKDAIQKEKASCDTIHKAKLATVKEYLFLLLLLLLLLLFVVVIVSCLLLFLICCCCCVVVLTLLYNECVLVCFSF